MLFLSLLLHFPLSRAAERRLSAPSRHHQYARKSLVPVIKTDFVIFISTQHRRSSVFVLHRQDILYYEEDSLSPTTGFVLPLELSFAI